MKPLAEVNREREKSHTRLALCQTIGRGSAKHARVQVLFRRLGDVWEGVVRQSSGKDQEIGSQ